MRKIGACVCSAVITVIALGSAGRVQAGPIESLALVAQVGGAFDYGIKVALDHGLVIAPGSSITLSGLAGVFKCSQLPPASVLQATRSKRAARESSRVR